MDKICVNCATPIEFGHNSCVGRLCIDVVLCNKCVLYCSVCKTILCPSCKFTCRYGCPVEVHCQSCFEVHKEESRIKPRFFWEQKWQSISSSSSLSDIDESDYFSYETYRDEQPQYDFIEDFGEESMGDDY